MEAQSKQFDDKINEMEGRFFATIDDFKKYYVYFNKNPEVDEFQTKYSDSKSQIQSITKELFLITNNIDKHINDLNSKLTSISERLTKEKNMNKDLELILTNLENTQNGSETLIDDSKREYNMQYYSNVELFLGTIIIGGLLATLFKKKT